MNLFTWLGRGYNVLGTLMANRAELERDIPEVLAFVDDVLVVWNKHQVKMLAAIPKLVPVVQKIVKQAESK